MSKISFTKETIITPTPVPGVEVESTITAAVPVVEVEVITPAESVPSVPVNSNLPAIVAPQPQFPAVTDSPFAFNDEDIGFDDIRLPRINIVQKVGDLSNVFNPGEIVLNGTMVIHEPSNAQKNVKGTGPLTIIILGFRKKQFCEKLEAYGSGQQGLLLNSEIDVVTNNGTLDYAEWKASLASAKAGKGVAKKYFQRLATALILIEKPSHVEDKDRILFPHECEGKFYALALWSLKGTSYTNAAKHIFTARRLGHLRSGYPTQAWSLTSKLETYGENASFIPVITPAMKSSESFLSFVREILGAGR